MALTTAERAQYEHEIDWIKRRFKASRGAAPLSGKSATCTVRYANAS